MLRLIDDREMSVEGESLKFERRRLPRFECESSITAYFTSAAPLGTAEARFGVLTLDVVDASPTGMGCTSRVPLEPGMRVSICPTGIPAAYKSGIVTRCRPEAGHYSIGLRYEYRAPAAQHGA